jgi:hypothetical protein
MSDPITTVRSVLQALLDADWSTFLAGHDPEALLIVGPQVLPKRLIEPEAFVMAQNTVASARAPATFRPHDYQVEALPSGDVVVLVGCAVAGAEPCQAAFLVGPTGIKAVAVDPVGPASVAREAAAVLAQLPLPIEWGQAFISPLHHAYAHRQGLAAAVRTLPEARFTCQGFGECCQAVSWQILVNDNTRQALTALTAMPGMTPLAFTLPAAEPVMGDPQCAETRHRFAASASGACAQVDDEGRCSIHATLGWQPSPPCQLYPIRAIRTPDGFDVTAVFHCQAVCGNLGQPLHEQGAEWRRRIWPFQFKVATLSTTLRRTRDDGEVLSWTDYRALESSLLDYLAACRHEGAAGLMGGTRAVIERLGLAGRQSGTEAESLFAPLLRDVGPGIPGDSWLGDGSRTAWAMALEVVRASALADELVVRYLRAVLFRKEGLKGGGAALPWGTVLVVARMVALDAAYRARFAGRSEPSDDDCLQAVRATEAIVAEGPYVLWLAVQPEAPLECPAVITALATYPAA